MADERVLIEHPDVKKVAGPVRRSTYEKVWKPKGWRLHTSKKKES
jgi:hypothetical protein